VLYEVFLRADKDGGGTLDLVEVLDFLHVKRSRFNKRVFSIFDEDRSGEIDFREFCVALWNYCTLSKHALVLFAFDLYDEDTSGTIEVSEMKQILEEVYGVDFKSSAQAAKILGKVEKMGNRIVPDITVEEFGRFCDKHPGLLYPAFCFQMELRRSIGGESFWKRFAKRRVELLEGDSVTVEELLATHVNEAAFKELAKKDIFEVTGKDNVEKIVGKKLDKRKRLGADMNGKFDQHKSGKGHALVTDATFGEVFHETGTLAQRRFAKGVRNKSKDQQRLAELEAKGRTGSVKKQKLDQRQKRRKENFKKMNKDALEKNTGTHKAHVSKQKKSRSFKGGKIHAGGGGGGDGGGHKRKGRARRKTHAGTSPTHASG